MPEKEYIERETVRTTIKNLCTKYNQAFGGRYGGGVGEELAKTIDNMPAADVASVRHGGWITQEGWTPDDYYYTCSICNEDFYMIVGTPSDNNYKFCPHCGAKMDKED